MVNEKLTIEIEEAKSWFTLAQVVMILAGFMFASSGIWINSTISLQNSGINILSSLNNSREISTIYFDISKIAANLMKNFFLFGSVITLMSLAFFIIGYYKINKLKHKYSS